MNLLSFGKLKAHRARTFVPEDLDLGDWTPPAQAPMTAEKHLAYIEGLTSVQALAARHKIALNRIGGPIHITTGRLLAKGMPADALIGRPTLPPVHRQWESTTATV